MPGYELKLNSLRPGRRHRALRRHPAAALRAPRGARGGAHQRARTATSARAPTSGCWPSRAHPWKVNFCKFTNETRNGIEDATAHSGPDLPRRGQRHRRRRRLRAGAGLRPDHAGRRQLLGRVAARGAAARRAARHRRPHPGDRQAAGAQGPRRRLRHASRGRPRQAGRRVAAGRRGGPASGSGTRRCAERAAAAAARSHPARRRRGDRAARRCSARRPTTASPTATSSADVRPGRGPRRDHRVRAGGRRARHRGARARARRRLLAAGHDPRARRPDPAAAHQRAGARHLGAPHAGRRRGRAGLRAGARRALRRRLAGQRDPPLLQAHAQAARRHQPQS